MEEKERYEIVYFDNDTSWKIIDNKTKKEVGGIDDMIKLLNQQDKRIKELEQENLSLQEQSIRDNQNWIEETTQLKQQLEEIKQNCNYQVMLMYSKENVLLKQQLKQSQKQVAIEELEFVLNNFRNRPAYFDVARQELCLSNQDKQFIDFINNRIKELKGV